MLYHPEFDPVALQIGPLAVRWYGLMYLVGFAAGILLGRQRIKSASTSPVSLREFDDLVFYIVLGVIIGGRVGYVVFYDFASVLTDPLSVLYVWHGGMSFHGGLIGVCSAVFVYARKRQKNWLSLTDFIAPLVPLGLAAGRLGNFINGELWGRSTDVPWGMVFPQSGVIVPRHPSQLYECLLEGVILFIVLWLYSQKQRRIGKVSGLFLAGYALSRFIVEFFREPDAHMGFIGLGLTMGQWLCVPMILFGVILMTVNKGDRIN